MNHTLEVRLPTVSSFNGYSAEPTSASEQRWVTSSSAPYSLAAIIANGRLVFSSRDTQCSESE